MCKAVVAPCVLGLPRVSVPCPLVLPWFLGADEDSRCLCWGGVSSGHGTAVTRGLATYWGKQPFCRLGAPEHLLINVLMEEPGPCKHRAWAGFKGVTAILLPHPVTPSSSSSLVLRSPVPVLG